MAKPAMGANQNISMIFDIKLLLNEARLNRCHHYAILRIALFCAKRGDFKTKIIVYPIDSITNEAPISTLGKEKAIEKAAVFSKNVIKQLSHGIYRVKGLIMERD